MIALLWLSCVALALLACFYRNRANVAEREAQQLKIDLAFLRGVHSAATLDDDDVPPVMRRREYMLGGTMTSEKQ